MNFDLTVLGEVAIDILDDKVVRPGGIAYSALAGAAAGAKVALIGTIGEEQFPWITSIFGSMGIETSWLYKTPASTFFRLYSVDEVEPVTAQITRGFGPPQDVTVERIKTRVLLLYPYEASIMRKAVHRIEADIVAVDLQYDVNALEDLDDLWPYVQIVFVSRHQAMKLTGCQSTRALAGKLLSRGVDTVVIKSGLAGSTIYNAAREIRIPRFEAEYRYGVGAGDVYNAIFLVEFMRTRDLKRSGYKAALAAAEYCEQELEFLLQSLQQYREFPVDSRKRSRVYAHPDELAEKQIYLAGPFFDEPQLAWVERLRHILEYHGFRIFSPYHEIGIITEFNDVKALWDTFKRDIEALQKSDLVVAILDGHDTGTAFEVGYAVRMGLPVIGIYTGNTASVNAMLRVACKRLVENPRQLLDALFEEFGTVQ